MKSTHIIKVAFGFILFLVNVSLIFAEDGSTQPIPTSSRQLIVVLTESDSVSTGSLVRFERDLATNLEWRLISASIPVSIGRNGLGWGKGMHQIPNEIGQIEKKEGDGKSPAGIFFLSNVFGYLPADEMTDLKMPYIHLSEMIECIDDTDSSYYNRIVSRSEVEQIDWRSSEKMHSYGIHYELGVVVNHNMENTLSGAGSCIFLHNWSGSGDKTSGCTSMDPEEMKNIIYWLDMGKVPLLVQLTRADYKKYEKAWNLPGAPKFIKFNPGDAIQFQP